MKKGYKELLAEANAAVEAVSADEAQEFLENEDVVFVDIRDSAELERTGTIPGAVHIPRGSLEFAVDPESPMHKPVFSSGKKFVFY